MRRLRNLSFVVLCLIWLSSAGSERIRAVEYSECKDEGQGWWVDFWVNEGFTAEWMANSACQSELPWCDEDCHEYCGVPEYQPEDNYCDPATQGLDGKWYYLGSCRCYADFVPEV